MDENARKLNFQQCYIDSIWIGEGKDPVLNPATGVELAHVAEQLDFGVTGINEGVMATEVAPFGGMKQSGLGREGLHRGIEEFAEMKNLFMGGISG